MESRLHLSGKPFMPKWETVYAYVEMILNLSRNGFPLCLQRKQIRDGNL